MKKLSNSSKETSARKSNLQLSVVDSRPMTAEEEHRFMAAIDALLSEIVRQELSRNEGDIYAAIQ